MLVSTTRFGELTVPDEEIIAFPAGLPGFESAHHFLTIEDEAAAPFVWLQSLDDPELAFLTVDPACFVVDYQPEMSDEAKQLFAGTAAPMQVLAIVTVPEDYRLMTVNLRAPLLINQQTRVARQEVGTKGKYPLRQRLIPAVATSGAQLNSSEKTAAGR
jgi:flagellar assembly factor FliW